MPSTTCKAAEAETEKQRPANEQSRLSPDTLPAAISLAQLYNGFVNSNESHNSEDELSALLVLNSCLRDLNRLQREDGDETYAAKLSLWVSKAILPNSEIDDQHEGSEQHNDAAQEKAITIARRKGEVGLDTLSSLFTLRSPSATLFPDISKVLIALLAFTSSRDLWTTPTSLSTAKHLSSLPFIAAQLETSDFIPTTLLQTFIRPLFTSSKPSSVTAAGRKAIPSSAPQKRHDFTVSGRVNKPWKYESMYSIPVLEWAINNISDSAIPTTWHLLIPPLLTLLDDPNTPTLIRGLSLSTSFLPKLSPKLLMQTGLFSVFEEAVMPKLLFVPSITPLSESLLLLPGAYEALFALCDVRFPVDGETKEGQKERIQSLDRVMRQGVLLGYFHTNEHPALVSILLSQMATLVQKMGVFAVKHLKDILPIISAVLVDPFAGARLEGVSTALKALQVVLLNCWARIGEPVWRVEVVKGLVVCWRMLEEVEGKEGLVKKVREEAIRTGTLFFKAVEGAVDMRQELRPLLEVDKGLGELFGFDIATGSEE